MTETTTQQQGSTQTTSDQSAQAGGQGATGGQTQAEPFYASFQDEALKTNPRFQRLGSVEDMARSLIHAESRLGVPEDQILKVPSDLKDEAAMRAIYGKLGLPDKPEGYNISLDAKASDADKAVLADFLGMAHKAGMPQKFAAEALQWWQGKVEASQSEAVQQAETARAAGETELKKEWGAAYDTKSKEIGRLALELGGKELAAELDGGKLGSHPQLARMLGKMIDRMAEPGADGMRNGEGAGLNAELTPAQAAAELNKFNLDVVKQKALMDPNHPAHKATVEERSRLLRAKEGRQQAA